MTAQILFECFSRSARCLAGNDGLSRCSAGATVGSHHRVWRMNADHRLRNPGRLSHHLNQHSCDSLPHAGCAGHDCDAAVVHPQLHASNIAHASTLAAVLERAGDTGVGMRVDNIFYGEQCILQRCSFIGNLSDRTRPTSRTPTPLPLFLNEQAIPESGCASIISFMASNVSFSAVPSSAICPFESTPPGPMALR